jgi:hypothetical protein
VGLLPLTAGAVSGSGSIAIDTLDPASPRFTRAYAEQTRGFIAAIVADRPVEVPGLEGRAALAIALAADRSMGTGLPVRVADVLADEAARMAGPA